MFVPYVNMFVPSCAALVLLRHVEQFGEGTGSSREGGRKMALH